MISDKAYIDPSAKLGKNVTVHPFAYIDANVEIGDNCEIKPYASILPGSRIGNNTRIFQGAIIGAEPQDFRWKGCDSYCYIGNNCVIREGVIINRGIDETGGTKVGDTTFVLAHTHIGHDCQLEGQSVIGNGVTFAGGVKVGKCVILSSNCVLHENSKIGDWVFVKGGCRINGNVPPYIIVAHNPVEYFGVNATVLRKKGGEYGITESMIDDIAKAYRHVYQSGTSVFNAMQRIEADLEDTPIRKNILDFIINNNFKIVAVPVEVEE